jgi:hypothetical protein
MAAPSSGARTVYTAYGTGQLEIRESLWDKLTNITRDDSKFVNMFPSEKIGNIYHSWLQESLAAPKANAWSDAEDFTFSARAARTRVGNWVQTFANTYKTGDLANAADSVGVVNEFAHETELAGIEHMTDINLQLIYGTSSSGDSATAATLRGISDWIATYTSTITAGAGFSSSAFNTLLQRIVTGGKSKPYSAVMSPSLKILADAWTGTNTRQIAMGPDAREFTDVVDVFLSSFGRVKMEYDINLAASYDPDAAGYDRCFLLDKSKWTLLKYVDTYTRSIPSTGLYKAGAVVTALSLRCMQEACNGKFLVSL